MSREYKGLVIPDRLPRENFNMCGKQIKYCDKSNCSFGENCNNCLFWSDHVESFRAWYLAKNKK